MGKHDGKTLYKNWAAAVLAEVFRAEGTSHDRTDERIEWLCSWAALEGCYVRNNPLGTDGKRPFDSLERGAEALVAELRGTGDIVRILADPTKGFVDFKSAVSKDPRAGNRPKRYVLHPPSVGRDWAWRPLIVWEGHPNP